MIKNQSIPALLTVTFIATIMGYTWGVYTQVNPGYDQGLREHFSATPTVESSVEEYFEANNNDALLLRPVTLNHTLANLSEHGSAVENTLLIVTVKKNNEGEYTVTPFNYEGGLYQVMVNETVLGTFSDGSFIIPHEYTKSSMKVEITLLSDSGTPIYNDDGEVIMAVAYIN